MNTHLKPETLRLLSRALDREDFSALVTDLIHGLHPSRKQTEFLVRYFQAVRRGRFS